jgi:hypothetical protein
MDDMTYHFPSREANKEEKAEMSYGLNYARAIYDVYTKDVNSLYNKKEKFVRNRKYAEGTHSTDKFRDMLGLNGDQSYLNLDFSPVPVVPKFVDLLVGELMNQEFRITAEAIDDRSLTRFDDMKAKLYANLILKDVSNEMEELTGVPIIDKSVPTFDKSEEVESYLTNTYKQASEKAIELGLTFVLQNNEIKELKKRLIRDFIVLKWGALKTYFDGNYDIKIAYVDPRNLVIPYTTRPDCSDLEYAGEIVKMNFHDLRLINRTLTDAQLIDIVKKYGRNTQGYSVDRLSEKGAYYYNDSRSLENFDDFYIDVLDFEFRSSNFDITYEKKYYQEDGFFLNKKSKGYEPNKDSKKKIEVISKDLEVYYDGIWIVGSEYVMNYGLRKNMPRPKVNEAYSSKTCSRFKIYAQDIYDMDNKSLVERMIPYADQMQLIHLKIQQFIAKAKPSGLMIDISGLEGVMMGKGDGFATPLELTEIYDQTGNYYFRGTDAEGQIMQRNPISPSPNGLNVGELQAFISMYNHNLNMIRDVTGINEFRDGSTPDNKTLVGVQKMAIGTSRNTTRPLNEAFLSVMNRTVSHCSLMIQMKAKYDPNGLKGFIPALGKGTVDILELNKEVSNATLGIKIDLLPDIDELQQVYTEIERALQTGNIDIEDALEVRDVLKTNTKVAIDLLKSRRRKKDEMRMQESMMLQQQNAQVQMQSSQAAAQAELQIIAAKNQAKLAEIQMEYQFKLQLAGINIEGDVLKEEARGEEKIKQIKFEKTLDYMPEKKRGSDINTFE